MYERLGEAVLKDGPAELGVLEGPDPGWAERLLPFLSHKSDPWNWQNEWCLTRAPEGLAPLYYVCHRPGELIANVCNFFASGVGGFSHVYTSPAHRQKGACGAIMKALFADFRKRAGRAMFLGTGYASVAYRIYERYGFRSVTEGSGFMQYFTKSVEEFEREHFAPGEARAREIRFGDWPGTVALFWSAGPTELRLISPAVIGRDNFEGAFLGLLRGARGSSKAGTAPSRACAPLRPTTGSGMKCKSSTSSSTRTLLRGRGSSWGRSSGRRARSRPTLTQTRPGSARASSRAVSKSRRP